MKEFESIDNAIISLWIASIIAVYVLLLRKK